MTEVGVIPEDWDGSTVRAIASSTRNAIVGGPFGSDLVSKDYVAHGVPVIRGQNMSSRWVSGSFVFVTPMKAKSLEANLAHPGDIVFTQRGTLGQVSLVPDKTFSAYLVSQSQMKLSVNRKVADPLFLYYFFTSYEQQKSIQGRTIQTGVPHINLGILCEIPVRLPPLAEQGAIAEALSDVDGLLAALEALIAKKRAIKQAAMQQLLTGKTRLPGFSGEWEIRPLGYVLSVRHGKSQVDVLCPDGTYPILASGGEIGRTDSFLYDKPSVLIGRKGTIDNPQFVSSPFWTIDTLFYTEIADKMSAKFLYYKFCTIPWRSYNEASGVPSLNAQTIENIEVRLPKADEQTAIATILSDMDTEITATGSQALQSPPDQARHDAGTAHREDSPVMKESQHTEWKQNWRDEYLRWICGFANAEGGVLVIGRNDEGLAVGVKDAEKLLEVLPNKIRDILGIVVDVDLMTEAGKELIEIRVEPYPSPISYKGEYHLRSGSTRQELKGAALQRFLMRKQGRHWDDAPVPGFNA